MITALIFDFDGLILDTETPDFQSWKETYAAYGLELPLEVWNDNIGSIHFFEPFAHMEKMLGKGIDRDAVRAQRRKRDNELLLAQRVLPGVEAYLGEAREMGLKTGVASSSRHEWVDGHLKQLGLFEQFDVILCRDDVAEKAKPDPAVYLAAIEALETRADRALALEDSPNGVQAAKDAGLRCVAVPNEMTRQMGFDHADLRLNSLADLSLSQLVSRVLGDGQVG